MLKVYKAISYKTFRCGNRQYKMCCIIIHFYYSSIDVLQILHAQFIAHVCQNELFYNEVLFDTIFTEFSRMHRTH